MTRFLILQYYTFAYRQSRGHGANYSKDLAEKSLRCTHSRKVDSVQITLHFGDSASSADWFDPDKHAGNHGKEQLKKYEAAKGFSNRIFLQENVDVAVLVLWGEGKMVNIRMSMKFGT